MTGVLGVYLVAAELSRRNFIVSITSRGAAGADLLVTGQQCKKAWSVQVKTNSRVPHPRRAFVFAARVGRHEL
jgi:hypothetical protein